MVSVTCNCVLLITSVVSDVPLITPTDDETNWLPFTVRTKPCCTWASVTVLADKELMVGDGRALPHAGLIELQACHTGKATRRATRARQKPPDRLMGDRNMRMQMLKWLSRCLWS